MQLPTLFPGGVTPQKANLVPLAQLALASSDNVPGQAHISPLHTPSLLLGISASGPRAEALSQALYALHRAIQRNKFHAAQQEANRAFQDDANAFYAQIIECPLLTIRKAVSADPPNSCAAAVPPTLELAGAKLLLTISSANERLNQRLSSTSNRIPKVTSQIRALATHCQAVLDDFDHLIHFTIKGDGEAYRCALRNSEQSLQLDSILQGFQQEIDNQPAPPTNAEATVNSDTTEERSPQNPTTDDLSQRISNRLLLVHTDHLQARYGSVVAAWTNATSAASTAAVDLADQVCEAIHQRASSLEMFRERTLSTLLPTAAHEPVPPKSSSRDPTYKMRLEILTKEASTAVRSKENLRRRARQEHTMRASAGLQSLLLEE